jgi:quinate/shikimate dehydrogenase (NAD+)
MTHTIRLGLLGNNIGRSRSKDLHEFLGKMYDLDVSYEPMDLIDHTAPVSIARELERCEREGFRGVNVTHPYKLDAFVHVTTVPDFPRGLTSVNTVLFTADGMLADNTDFSGCCRAFRQRFGSKFKPGRVLMLGAGGVGVAIAYALKELGVEELIVKELKEDLSKELVSQLAQNNVSVRLAEKDLVSEMRQADGLINATPIGMFQYPGNAFPEEGFKSQRWAFDAVYTPEKTAFLQKCSQCGIETLTGFYLFIYQGLDAFERFTGITVDAEMVIPAFLERFPLE